MRTYTYYVHKLQDKFIDPKYAIAIYRRSKRFGSDGKLRFWAGTSEWRTTDMSMNSLKVITFSKFCKKPCSGINIYDKLKVEWANTL